jgi:hypothetical protein
MTFQPAPGCAKVACIGTYGTQQIVDVLHFYRSTPFDVGDLEDLATDVQSIFQFGLEAHQDAEFSYTEFVATDISTEDGPVFTLTCGTNSGALDGGESLPGNVAACVTKRTAKRGRSYRGRLFLGAINSVARSAVNLLSSTYVGHFLTDLAPLLAPMSTSGFVFGIVSRYLNGVKRSTAVFEPVTALTMDQSLDNMRRRSDGRGA